MDDVTKCSGNNCTFIVSLKNNDNRAWVGDNVNVSSLVSYTTACNKGTVSTTEYFCIEKNLTVTCDGSFDGTILSRCPFRVRKPSCDMLTVTSDESTKCTVLSFDATTTKCQCAIPFTRLEYPSSSSSSSSSSPSSSSVLLLSPSLLILQQQLEQKHHHVLCGISPDLEAVA